MLKCSFSDCKFMVYLTQREERRIMDKIINFNPEGMKGLHFYIEGLTFPIAIGTYSDWEEVQVSYLSNNIKNGGFNSEAICRWCKSHQIQYRILYPIKKSSIWKNPYKYFKFVQLKKKLNYSL